MTLADDLPVHMVDERIAGFKRRAMLGRVVAFVSSLSLSGMQAMAAEPTIEDIERLGKKAKLLRAEVRKNGKKAAGQARSELKTVLQPLQQEMKSLASRQKNLAVEMEGHLLELQEALDNEEWDAYTSKSTKDNYPGGRPERELEEVEETLNEYLKLVKSR